VALVLVTGGTGQLGREVVPRLVSNGHDVRLLSRQDRPTRPSGVEAVRGDVLTGDGIDRAVSGVDVVVHCATSPFRRTRRTEVDGTRQLTTAAARARRPHLVYVSIVGVDRHPLPYYKAKRAAEVVVEAAGLPHTIQRATQFHSLIDGFLTRLARLPVLPVPRGVRFQPIDAAEVAARLVSLVDAGPAGHVADMGGPEVRGFDDLARAWLGARGRSRRVAELPIAGRIARAFKDGVNLCPAHADGTLTWEDWLTRER
jgi:uncharacterized protein YbjT (DUF2867 family)